jgi:hypothetical protein
MAAAEISKDEPGFGVIVVAQDIIDLGGGIIPRFYLKRLLRIA